jgi:hypothetical protein
VKTAEDFGTQGALPTHPELLDWLAVEFATDWDVKRLHKLIVTSATYRQSSRVTPELLARDPENKLLARFPRLRLSAEVLRDQALSASGLLVEKLGGPSVKPYQPAGLWNELSGAGDYVPDTGECIAGPPCGKSLVRVPITIEGDVILGGCPGPLPED